MNTKQKLKRLIGILEKEGSRKEIIVEKLREEAEKETIDAERVKNLIAKALKNPSKSLRKKIIPEIYGPYRKRKSGSPLGQYTSGYGPTQVILKNPFKVPMKPYKK